MMFIEHGLILPCIVNNDDNVELSDDSGLIEMTIHTDGITGSIVLEKGGVEEMIEFLQTWKDTNFPTVPIKNGVFK